jgi:hypothetical protein
MQAMRCPHSKRLLLDLLTEFRQNPELCSILVYERGLIELEQAAHRC